MHCYEQFGWNYADIETLPQGEAQLLSIYFEETAHYQAEQLHKSRSNSSSVSSNTTGEWADDTAIGDDDAPELYEDPDDDE